MIGNRSELEPVYEIGDLVRVNNPDSTFHNRVGKVVRINIHTYAIQVQLEGEKLPFAFRPEELGSRGPSHA
jgi:ribosomal protein L21E